MLSSRREYRRALAAVCGCVTLLVVLLGWQPIYWPAAELGTRDFLIRYGRKAEARQDLVFLAIDNASVTMDEVWDADSPFISEVQKSGFPWPRDVYPMIIDRLVEAGAKVVAFDLIFPTPREGDGKFRRAIEKNKDRVVIGSSFETVEVAAGQSQRSAMDQYQPPAATIILPGSDLESCCGFVTVWTDFQDVAVRRVQYRRNLLEAAGIKSDAGAGRGPALMSLSARVLEKAGASANIPSEDSAIIRWVSPSQDNRLDPSHRNFVPHSLYRIFVKKFWEQNYGNGAFFKDKIVLIGPYGPWSKDVIQATPFGEMPGPLFHLNAINAALNRDFIREAPLWVNTLLILLGGAGAYYLCRRVENPVRRVLAFLGLSAVYWGAAQLAYNYFPSGGVLVFLLSPLVALNASGVIWFAYEQVVEQTERRRVRGIFERYVSRNVVNEVLDNPQTFLQQLGGVRKTCAILFTDLRGFTSRTESGDSQQLVAQLNEYFDEMVKIVFDMSGTFDKCIGDAVMAVWGNIHSDGAKRDVEQAVEAAVRMMEAVRKLNQRWEERGWEAFRVGAGLNQGAVIAGNMGGQEKMEVTVIGDAVNMASRLESATKEYGVEIVLGQSAGELARDAFHLLTVDSVQLLGKSAPVEVFTVLARKSTPLSAELKEFMELHEEAIKAYRAQQFLEAHGIFSRCLELNPESNLTRVYIHRCEMLSANPPEPGWDGVYVMTKK